jgi:hypothetical protein
MPRLLLNRLSPEYNELYTDPGGKHEYPLTAEELAVEPNKWVELMRTEH